MPFFGLALASLAALGTYASLSATEFGPLAVIPALFVGVVVMGPFKPQNV